MKIFRNKSNVAFLLSFLILTTCFFHSAWAEELTRVPSKNENSINMMRGVGTVDTSSKAQIVVISPDQLSKSIIVSEPDFKQFGMFTEAQVQVENISEERYGLEYQFQWEDENGFKVGESTPWMRFTLSPKQKKNISQMSKVPEAKGIIFSVRHPKDMSW